MIILYHGILLVRKIHNIHTDTVHIDNILLHYYMEVTVRTNYICIHSF